MLREHEDSTNMSIASALRCADDKTVTLSQEDDMIHSVPVCILSDTLVYPMTGVISGKLVPYGIQNIRQHELSLLHVSGVRHRLGQTTVWEGLKWLKPRMTTGRKETGNCTSVSVNNRSQTVEAEE